MNTKPVVILNHENTKFEKHENVPVLFRVLVLS